MMLRSLARASTVGLECIVTALAVLSGSACETGSDSASGSLAQPSVAGTVAAPAPSTQSSAAGSDLAPAPMGQPSVAGMRSTTLPSGGAGGSQVATPPAADGGKRGEEPDGGAGTSGTSAPVAGAAGAMPSAGSAAPRPGEVPASCTRIGAATADTPTIWVIGDSTASVYAADLYPRTGWAQPLQDYFAPACARVQDKALSGRSSKSFYDEGAWTPIQNALRAGDFVLIQFGHNDEKSDDALRYTEPSKTYKQFLTHYIDDTEAKGATAILMTSIERNKWTNGQLASTHGAYPDAVRQLAEARKLTLVDMTRLTHDYFQNLGQTSTTALFLNLSAGQFPNYPNGNSDDTHLQERGAHVVAEIALAELARQRVALAALLEHVPAP